MTKIIITLFLLLSNILHAQVTQEWVATYAGTGSGYNFPKKSAIDKSGNFIVAGNSESSQGYDYITLKYSPSGNLIWSQRYNGIGNNYDYVSGMVIDDSGNVYVSGASQEGISLGGINWVTIKYNPDGQMQWKRSMNWTANNTDEPFGMNIDRERNIYVIGYGKTDGVHRQMVTIKYSSDGDSLWTKVYRSSQTTHDWGYSVVTDDSLNVYSSGYGILPVNNEIVTLKYDSDGAEKWIKKYPTYEGDWLRPVLSEVDIENNIIVIGYSYFSNNYDIVTLKYTPDGDLLWSRNYNGGNTDRANSMCIDKNSNILIGGYTTKNTEGDFLILKYSSKGDILLLKNVNGEDSGSTDEAFSILLDKNDYIYVSGYSQSSTFHYDYLTLKINPDGHTVWYKRFRTQNDNYAYCLNLDSAEGVFVSGEGEVEGGNSSIISVKYSQLTGIKLSGKKESENFELNNFPNPFNPVTQINFQIPTNSFIRLIVFDVSGREIETLLNEFKNKGKYKINFKSNNYSSGVYFYSLYSDGILVKTNKMVLMR